MSNIDGMRPGGLAGLEALEPAFPPVQEPEAQPTAQAPEAAVVRHPAGFDPEAAPELGPRSGPELASPIQTLQRALNDWRHRVGDRPIGTDGSFGSGTKKALLAFQRSNGLPETGECDRATWRTLGTACTARQVTCDTRTGVGPPQFSAACMPTVRTGHKDPEQIRTLQDALNVWRATRNLPPLASDGDFGSATRMAAIEFQRANGLPASGIVGPDTWARLEALSVRDFSSARAPVGLDVPWFSQYDTSGRVRDPGDTACFRASSAMIREFLANTGLRATLNDVTDRIDVARCESECGDVRATRGEADGGRAYIDRCLDAGLPALVGVSHKSGADYNANKVTDHFVVITGRGRDETGREYYAYSDPSTTDPQKGQGRFHVDAEGKLEKAGSTLKRLLTQKHWEVSEVRTWRELP